MHERNPYRARKPDFAALAAQDAALRPFVTESEHGASIDFGDSRALRALTAALLRADFGLDVALRDDRLCPTVANRLDYVLTCLDLAAHAPPGPLRALDVGTGHVAIYPLLLRALRGDAQAVGSEIDATSLAHARAQLQRNAIPADAVRIEGEPADRSLLGHLKAHESWAFTMCNPPFFGSAAEAEAARAAKATPAPAAPTCAPNEQVTAGGEERFVGRMIDESAHHAGRVGWFTSLVGRYASLGPLVRHVLTKTTNYAVIALRQGNTTRWVLAWTFTPYRLPDSLTRPAHVEKGTSFAKMVSLSNSFVHNDEERDLAALKASILPVLESVGLSTTADDDGLIRLAPTSNSWSRQARRAAQRAAQDGNAPAAGAGEGSAPTSGTTPAADQEPLFRARLTFSAPELPTSPAPETATTEATPRARATLEWDWGRDRTTVDAFWKFVITKAGLRKRRQPEEESPAEKRNKPTPAGEEEQQTNNPYLQHQGNPYLAFSGADGDRGRGRGRGGGRGGRGRGRGRGGSYSRPQDQGWTGRQ